MLPKDGGAPATGNDELAPKVGAALPPVKLNVGFDVSAEVAEFPNENTPALVVAPVPKLKDGVEFVVELLGFPKGVAD